MSRCLLSNRECTGIAARTRKGLKRKIERTAEDAEYESRGRETENQRAGETMNVTKRMSVLGRTGLVLAAVGPAMLGWPAMGG
jgi:hypothetical protein